jgi:drug/metabolite transporter (DMT)-like permease
VRVGDRLTASGPLLVALAALCWGLSGGIASVLISRGFDPFVLAFYRGAIGLLFILAWLASHPQKGGFADYRLWLWAGLAGLGVAGNFAFYFISIEHGSIAIAATLMYCAPVYVYVVSFALKLEASAPWKSAAIAGVIVGIVMLTRIYDVSASEATAIGIASGLLAGLCYAVFIFAFKFATPHGSAPAILVIAFAVLATILAWLGDADQTATALRTPDWPLFIALGLLGAGLSFFLYVVGMRGTKPTTASIVAMIEPITASLFGVAILRETLAVPQLFGMGLILVTVTALSVHSGHAGDT